MKSVGHLGYGVPASENIFRVWNASHGGSEKRRSSFYRALGRQCSVGCDRIGPELGRRQRSGKQMTDNQERNKAIQDLWTRTLAQVPTTFGRVAYLASLRDPNTGRYEHFGLAQIYSLEEADQALRWSHARAFSDWLNYSLAEQKDDLEAYLLSLEGDRQTVLRTWATLSPYRNLLPADASEAERQLFMSDLELILDLLRTGPSPSWQSSGA